MTIKVEIEVNESFVSPKSVDEVFALLADVPESASYFPDVEELNDLGDNCFQWKMEKVGAGDHAIQTIYSAEYTVNAEEGTITWEPIEDDEGNSEVSGSWTISETDEGTLAEFSSNACLTLPLPGLLKMAISPVVKKEFGKKISKYLEGIEGALS